MRHLAIVVLTAALCPIALAAQTAQTYKAPANPVSDSVRELLARDSKNLVAAAELMPAEKYGYHPTPAQMTFGQLVVHIVQTNVALCSGAAGTPAPEAAKLADTDAKDTLIAAMKKSFDYCTEALAKVNDSQIGEEVVISGRHTGMPRAKALIIIATDWADHYSTAASYLRLNDILPPTAKPKQPK